MSAVLDEKRASGPPSEDVASGTELGGGAGFSAADDKALLRKIDRHLLPALTLLYLLSFLDRANIGNAKLDGLTKDINVAGSNYNTALAIYFVGYVLFEVPANIVLKRFNPRVWLPLLTFVWGIVSITQGLVHNQAGLFAVRFFLGVSEAGLFPGTIFVFSMYYKRSERHWRVAVFFGGAAVAGAFGGVLAYGIGKMDGVGGKRGWAWIFILEGLLTCVCAALSYFIVPTWPHEATFLTASERERLIEKLKLDSDAGVKQPFRWSSVRKAISDPFVLAYAFLFHGFAFVLYSFSLFLPTIIAGLGFATWKAQLMTVPPYAAAALGIGLFAWAAAHFKRRGIFIIIAGLIAILGYILLLATDTSGKQYVGVFFAAIGIYSANALLLSWPGENVSDQTKRAIAVALQISIGDVGAIAGVLIYRPQWVAHRYRKPHIISIGYLVFGIAVAAYLSIAMDRENKRRDAIQNAPGYVETKEEHDEELGDRHISWRYQI